MNKIDLKCIECKSDKYIKLEENKSKVTFHNPSQKQYECIKVDGCAITDGVRCDYLLRRNEEELEYFIELKGCDVGHAISQLRASIKQLSSDAAKKAKTAFVISTKPYPLTNATVQLAMKEFKTKFNALLVVKRTPYIYNLP